MKFPNDADGDALRSLFNDGVNFKKPQAVEFFVAVLNRETGEKIAQILKDEGFHCLLEQDDETDEWACSFSKRMLLNYSEIVKMQRKLDEICQPHGGNSDGWGIFID